MCDLHLRLAQLSSQTWKKTSQQQTRRHEKCHTWKETGFVKGISSLSALYGLLFVVLNQIFILNLFLFLEMYLKWSQSSIAVQAKVNSELLLNHLEFRNGLRLFWKVKSWFLTAPVSWKTQQVKFDHNISENHTEHMFFWGNTGVSGKEMSFYDLGVPPSESNRGIFYIYTNFVLIVTKINKSPWGWHVSR